MASQYTVPRTHRFPFSQFAHQQKDHLHEFFNRLYIRACTQVFECMDHLFDKVKHENARITAFLNDASVRVKNWLPKQAANILLVTKVRHVIRFSLATAYQSTVPGSHHFPLSQCFALLIATIIGIRARESIHAGFDRFSDRLYDFLYPQVRIQRELRERKMIERLSIEMCHIVTILYSGAEGLNPGPPGDFYRDIKAADDIDDFKNRVSKRWKKLSLLIHPDKHSQEEKIKYQQAQTRMNNVKEEFEQWLQKHEEQRLNSALKYIAQRVKEVLDDRGFQY